MNRTLIYAACGCLLAGGLCGEAVGADLDVGKIQLDRIQWGMRAVTFDTDNPRGDTAQIEVEIKTEYGDNYVSGLNMYVRDTIVLALPLATQKFSVPFELPGSFGRAITRVRLYWHYLHPWEGDKVGDTVAQTFSSVFIPKDEALPLVGRRYSVGPAYSKVDHPLMDFELPRLLLFLLSRGGSLKEVQSLLIVEDGYTEIIYRKLRDDGFFPFSSDTLAPGIIAFTEQEAFALRTKTQQATELFTTWYESGGRENLSKILKKGGLDEFTREFPAIRMKVLLTLLEGNWADSIAGIRAPRFENLEQDLATVNRPRWIVGGGDFFMPRLCLGEFIDKGLGHLATFSPDPTLPFDVASIWSMREAVLAAVKPPEVELKKLQKIIKAGQKAKTTEKLAADLKAIITSAQSDLPTIKPYQIPYLAVYFIRIAVGNYFAQHKAPSELLDCVTIRFQK